MMYGLPVIFKDFNPNLFNPMYGFVGMYTKDINKPFLCNHLFLVYKLDPCNIPRFTNIYSLYDTFYTTYITIINKEAYQIYAFLIPVEYREDISKVCNGNRISIYLNTKNIINDFWKFPKKSYEHWDLFENISQVNDKLERIIPEEDPPLKTDVDILLEGLTVVTPISTVEKSPNSSNTEGASSFYCRQ